MLVQSCNQSYYNAYALRLSRIEVTSDSGVELVLHKAANIKLWREIVLYRYPICANPQCIIKSYDPHHVVRRGYKEFKMLVENGIGFCRQHHIQVENLGWDSYWDLMRVLLGVQLCSYLQDHAI